MLRWVSWVVVVAIPLQVLTISRLDDTTVRTGVLRGVAALVGVVPEGLVLLSTLTFFAAALTLSRQGVLVQELRAVEGLARVNVVCVDKTGTLTTGIIEFDSCEIIKSESDEITRHALAVLAHDIDSNATGSISDGN